MRNIAALFMVVWLVVPLSAAAITITDGMNASDLIGQYTTAAGQTVSYTKRGGNNGPNEMGFNFPADVALDSANHRMFIVDGSNNRVLVYDLNSSNQLVDKVPDHVLGQVNYYSSSSADTQSGLNTPRGLAYDSANNLLYVTESSGNRVKVFDVASIADGENAVHVLGQTTFTGASSADTQSGLNAPQGLAYDSANNLLYVAESSGNRVKVFDVASITDGENAVHVLGQTTFTGASAADTQSGLSAPLGLAYDSANNLLYVAESEGVRVKVFDVASITDGENAVHVLGQTTFTDASFADSASGMRSPNGLAYDSANHLLYVSESGGARVKVFDVASITDGESAVHVLGQTTFTGASFAYTQSGMAGPYGLAYDSANHLLYVTDISGNHVKVFDVASITNGEDAVDLIGQYTTAAGQTVSYTKRGFQNNGPNEMGFSLPVDVALDSANHRMFIVDSSNNRVLVYDLNSSNQLVDKVPDHVLGQVNYYSSSSADTQSGLHLPRGLAYDSANNLLYVAEESGNRVKVFDVTSITDGENAVHVLGQTTFAGFSSANTQSGLKSPQGLAYDSTNHLLYVAEGFTGNRVKVFDVTSITDGENAVHVLGQTTFTGNSSANTQSGLNNPYGLAYDSANNLLYVAEDTGNRVKVFDVTSITDGENAVHVLGQTTWSGTSSADTQSGLSTPTGLAYDSANNLLYVTEYSGGNRVKVFDMTDPPIPVPPRTMRLFEGFTVKLMSGTIKIFPAE